MARILVIDDDASLLQMMSLMLKRAGHEAILANDGQEGIELGQSEQPDLAVVDLMMPDITGIEVCRTFRTHPLTTNIPLLVLTALSQPEQRAAAQEAGADDFIAKPVTREDLIHHVEELLENGARNFPADLKPSAADTSAQVGDRAPEQDNPVIAVMGLAAGVGATTLALNLGVGLMDHGRACLADLTAQGGHMAVQLRMVPPRATWVNLISVAPGADKRLIGGALTLNQATGVTVLPAPLEPVAERMGNETITYLLDVLTEGFGHVVIDLPSVMDDMSSSALSRADHIVLVLGEDPASLPHAGVALESVESMGLSGQVSLVLNHTRPHGISSDEAMHTLNHPFVASIPYEPAQADALRQGLPLIVGQPDSLFARAVQSLIRLLA